MAYPIPKLSDADVPNTVVNRNKNFQFNTIVTTSLKELSANPCGQATIKVGHGEGVVEIYDGSQLGQNHLALDSSRAFSLSSGESFTFHGLTNSNQLTAKATIGTGDLFVRTEFYSGTVQF